MIEIATKIVLCLLIAALLGGIIGYLIGRIQKCDKKDLDRDKLDGFDEEMDKPLKIHEEKYVEIPKAKNIKENIEGARPIAYPLPLNGEADDLKKIVGIGINIENALYEIGVFHYSQIATWTKENVKWIDEYLSYEGRVEREEWIEQARKLAK